MAKTVVGLFDSIQTADTVIDELRDAGAGPDHLSVVRQDTSDLGLSGDAGSQGTTASGAAVGGGMKGLRGLLHGSRPHTAPGMGSIRASGHLAQHLTGNSGLLDALKAHGVPDDEAHFYSEGVRRGSTLVMARVHDDDADEVSDVMQRHGAVDIHSRRNHFQQSGWKQFDHTAKPLSHDEITREHETYRKSMTGSTPAAATTNKREGEVAIPVVEEQLAVGKREVERRGVRVYTHVTEKPVAETVRLREEHIRVERRPVDRAVTPGQVDALREGSIEMTERSEEAVVSKTARVKEEVVVSKEAVEREETVRDTVRSSDVRVEEVGGTGTTRNTGTTGTTGNAGTTGTNKPTSR